MQAAQTSRGIVLTLDDVLFDTGKAELKSGAQRSLDQIAAFLNENPERRVQVEGFTDSQGTDDYNLELSQSRADAVAMAIIQRGIDAQRVRALGYGEEFPGREQRERRQPPAEPARRDHRRRTATPRFPAAPARESRENTVGEFFSGGFRRRLAEGAQPAREAAHERRANAGLRAASAIRPACSKVRELIGARRAHGFDRA